MRTKTFFYEQQIILVFHHSLSNKASIGALNSPYSYILPVYLMAFKVFGIIDSRGESKANTEVLSHTIFGYFVCVCVCL